jgi:hypothetical protein
MYTHGIRVGAGGCPSDADGGGGSKNIDDGEVQKVTLLELDDYVTAPVVGASPNTTSIDNDQYLRHKTCYRASPTIQPNHL